MRLRPIDRESDRLGKLRAARGIFTSKQARRHALIVLGLATLGLVASSLLVSRYAAWLLDPTALQAGIERFGVLAPIAFVLLQAVQVIIAPIPGQVLGFAAGFLFGTLRGTIYSLLGAAIGSYVVFRISRHYGRHWVEKTIAPELVARFDDLSDRNGLLALFVVFLIPGIPDDVICFVAGLSSLDIRKMVLVSVVGRVPGYAITNAAGAQLAANRLVEMAVLIGIMLGLTIVGYLWRQQLLDRLESLTAGASAGSEEDRRG